MEGHVHVPQETTQTSEGYYPAPKQFSSQPIPSFYIASNTDGPPPPYLAEYASDPPPVQQSNTNVVLVNQQPQPRILTTTNVETGDHFFILSVIMTVMCCFCGTWFALPCSIAAIAFALQAKEHEKQRDYDNMEHKSNAALGCNIGAIVTWIIAIVVAVTIIFTRPVCTYDSSTNSYRC